MLVDYSSTRCVNLCQPVCIRGTFSIVRQVDSHLNKARPVALKVWSCPVFNEQEQIAKKRASVQRIDSRKLTTSVLMVFVFIATLCLKDKAALTTFVRVKKFALLALKTIFNVVVKREGSMKWDEAIYEKKAWLFLKRGNVIGGECTGQAILKNNITQKFLLTGDHLQQNTNC